MEEQAVTTITVLRSWPSIRPDGRQAIVLETRESGPIAFEVTPEALAALRRAIAMLEAARHQGGGTA
jgi:hypothetical protein